MNPILSALLVNVGSKVLSNKIIGDPDYPAQIGYGTEPTPQPGPSMDIDLPEGSDFESLLNDADLGEEELALLLQILSEQENTDVMGLADGGDVGSIEAYEPSPLENQQQTIANFLLDKGLISDNYRAQRLAEKMTFMSEFIPGFGDVQGLREGKFMMDEGNPMMGGIMMGASMLPFIPGSFLARKAGKLQQTIKQSKFDEQRELRNVGSGDGNAAQEAAERARKKHIKAQRQLDEMVAKEKATPNLEPTVTKKEVPKAVQQEMDFSSPSIPKGGIESLLNKELAVHSSPTTGIQSLKLDPSGTSPGGLYLNRSFSDPRIFDYSEGLVSQGSPKGAAYLTRPNFSRTLDVENIDKNTLNRINEIIGDFRPKGSPTAKNTNTEYVLQGMLKNKTKDNMYFPHGFSEELNTNIADLGFDSLRYPPRKGFEKLGESDTLISLFPEENLDMVEEIPFEDIYKRMYELRKYNE